MPDKKFIILSFIFIVTVAILSFLVSPFFLIRDFNVSGLDNLSAEQIEDILNPFFNKNIWVVNTETLENRIGKFSYVADASVSRSYPDTLQIKINERIPLARIYSGGSYFLICENGYILERGSEFDISVPLIKDMGYFTGNDKLLFQTELTVVMQALSVINQRSRQQIEVITYGDNQLELSLQKEVTVFLGKLEELERKFKIVESMIEKIEKGEVDLKYINLSIVDRPVFKEIDA